MAHGWAAKLEPETLIGAGFARTLIRILCSLARVLGINMVSVSVTISFLLRSLSLVAFVCAAELPAQAARLGRQPVLGPISPASGHCQHAAPGPRVAGTSIKQFISLRDSVAHRLIGVGIDASGRARFLDAMMYEEQARRHETESVSIFFSPAGQIVRGERRAFTTGTPASRSEDRRGTLLEGDTIAARELARAVIRRCLG